MVWVKQNFKNELDVTKDKADELFNKYHSKVPFVKQLMNKAYDCSKTKVK